MYLWPTEVARLRARREKRSVSTCELCRPSGDREAGELLGNWIPRSQTESGSEETWIGSQTLAGFSVAESMYPARGNCSALACFALAIGATEKLLLRERTKSLAPAFGTAEIIEHSVLAELCLPILPAFPCSCCSFVSVFASMRMTIRDIPDMEPPSIRVCARSHGKWKELVTAIFQ